MTTKNPYLIPITTRQLQTHHDSCLLRWLQQHMAVAEKSYCCTAVLVLLYRIRSEARRSRYAVSYLRYEVHTPLAFLLLELERNTSYRPPLDALHEVCHKASNLVAHPLGRNDGNFVAHAFVRVEVHGQTRVVLLDDGSRRLLHGLRADTLHRGSSAEK